MKKALCWMFAGYAALSLAAEVETYDVVIYGGSPAALSAAVQAKRMGVSCVIVSPDRRIGGLSTGGLGQTDIGHKSAFGGIALEFYRDIARHYADPASWKWQRPTEYRPDGQCAGTRGDDAMWTFEPSAALKVLEGWEKRDGLEIRRGKRLDRSPGKVKVEEVDGRGRQRKIVSLVTEDGTEYRGKMFIDATYEGDLMAAAGVSYTVGREGNEVYGETVNGIQRRQGHHKFEKGVSAYVVAGDPSSGLLPFVERDDPRPDGSGDGRVQAYCFRMCLTDVPENRIPFVKPEGYDPLDYELLVRNLVAQERAHPEWRDSTVCWDGLPWIDSRMPNRKTDANNRSGFSTDFIGQNHRWPEAGYDEREKILRRHLAYQQGLMWTLANDGRIPARIRNEFSKWGTCKDEFEDGLGHGWQRQLYVREARRMKGAYVMTERHCRWGEVAPHPVAMAAYQLDSHHCRRYVDADGCVQNEGDVEIPHLPDGKTLVQPYGIDYGALTPKKEECANLLVPVCVSASHMAYGSIRMEPVFFALGQAAGTAAALAVGKGTAVQDVSYPELAGRLLSDGQVIGSVRPHLRSGRKGRLENLVVLAAANASDEAKSVADLVCAGHNDERVINAAIAALTRGGTVQLLDGDYYIDAFEQENDTAILYGYNGGQARTVNFCGTTENKSYNTRFGVTIHVTEAAMGRMEMNGTYRVFCGTPRRPKAEGDFYTMTHVNNANFANFYLYFHDASKPLRGIDGSNFGQMHLEQVGVYTENYFRDRFVHLRPATPCRGSVGIYSVPGSNDEMSRIGYDYVNVGGLYIGFYQNCVDHLVMKACSACRCCYGYYFDGGPKTLTMINCCDEGCTHLPRFVGRGHLTAIDFNLERFNEAYIPKSPDGDVNHGATEAIPGGWRGFISYTLQGRAFGLLNACAPDDKWGNFSTARFWEPGCGTNFRMVDLNGK